MRLELGTGVDCADGRYGKLVDVVIDPTSRRVTHLVVEPDGEPPERLVPVELAQGGEDPQGAVVVRATAEEMRRLPPVREVAYLRLGDVSVDDPDWDVGIEEVFALPYYSAYDLEPSPLDFATAYDRVPKGEVEIRRTSAVTSADGHHLGHVDGFVVDDGDRITHLVLERGHLLERREITIPIGAVARVETDAVTLSLTLEDVRALPAVPVRHWPPAIAHGTPQR
jgi:sporulation protein YlmC with PRC-barrel domain